MTIKNLYLQQPVLLSSVSLFFSSIVAETANTDSAKTTTQSLLRLNATSHKRRLKIWCSFKKMVLINWYQQLTNVVGMLNFTITVEGGKITKSDFDNLTIKVNVNQQMLHTKKSMKDKSGNWTSWIILKRWNEGLVSKQNPKDVEVVAEQQTHILHLWNMQTN